MTNSVGPDTALPNEGPRGAGAPLLRVEHLKVHFPSGDGWVRAVDDIDFDILPGETLALVGESGCGKSVTALSMLQLIDRDRGELVEGRIHFDGRDLLALPLDEMRRIRGNDIAMIFQEPMTSLNPVYTVGDQIAEALKLHQGLREGPARREVVQLLKAVKIPLPQQRADEYPHQLSGGMRQRVMIAMALACRPKLLIADEPTTALDVTVQAQILELMQQLQEQLGMSILLITHDLGVVAEMAHRAVVMYAGRVAELGPVQDVFNDPKHPYTVGLLRSLPNLERHAELTPIEGQVPDATAFPAGCRFHPRCPQVLPRCRELQPELNHRGGAEHPVNSDIDHAALAHCSACHFVDEHPGIKLLSLPPRAKVDSDC